MPTTQIFSPRVVRGNRGDLLSRYCILKHLGASRQGQVTALAARPRDTADLDLPVAGYGPMYNAVPTLSGLRSLLRADIVVWTGGLDLQDDSSLAKLLHTLLVFGSYRLLGKKIVVLCQGAGPLTTTAGRGLARLVLDRAAVFLARDRKTWELLAGLGSKTRLLLGRDGIFAGSPPEAALDPAHSAVVDRLLDAGGRPVVGFNIRMWFHFASSLLPFHLAKKRYRQRAEDPMRRLVDAAARFVAMLRSQSGARVVLVSMYEPGLDPWEDDLPLLEKVKRRFGDDHEVVVAAQDLDLNAFCRLVGGLDVMVGCRLHSALTALRQGVPAVVLNYTLKGRDIFCDLGLEEWVVELDDFMRMPQLAATAVEKILADPGSRSRVERCVQVAVAENQAGIDQAMAEAGAGR